MNVFALDESPILSARWQHDRHVVKMTLESLQLLSTACHLNESLMAEFPAHYLPTLYKPISNPNHPSAVWARESVANFVWLVAHEASLMGEYHHRFTNVHKGYPLSVAFTIMAAKLCNVERFWTRAADRSLVIDPAILDVAAQHSPFHFAGPAQFAPLFGTVIESYRAYYLGEKLQTRSGQLNRWTNPSLPLPAWLAPHATIHVPAPAVVREVVKPHVPAGFSIPSFLKNLVK